MGVLVAKRYRFAFKRLDVYQAAVEHFDWTCSVVQRMPRGPYKVTDQAVGASLSVMGNIGEAHGRETKPGEIEQHYRYAQGSTFESATHLDAFSALDVITDEEYNAEEERLARIAMMLTKLIQKQRRKRATARSAGRRTYVREGRPVELSATPGPEEAAREGSNPSNARPGPRSAARFESRRVPQGAQRPTGIESPRSGVSTAASAAGEIEPRTPKSAGP